jgi:concentrative nucleoside transporter, CNT family
MAAYFAFGVSPSHILTAVIMTAPGTILLSKMLVPEVDVPETVAALQGKPTALAGEIAELQPAVEEPERPDANLLDAASRGTREGMLLAANIAAMLISFLGLIALLNMGLRYGGSLFGVAGLSLQGILGWMLSPVAWILGVRWDDCRAVGGLLGTRTVLNELIAFGDLGTIKDSLHPRSFAIATFALCGFANLSSIGIQLGGIGALAPERRGDLARLGFKALLAGTLANFLSACIAGILI